MPNPLRAQLQSILSQNDPVLEHEWLCHPGKRCEDGCDVAAIPERLAVYQEPNYFELALDKLAEISEALECETLSSTERRALYARATELDGAIT